MSKINKTSEQGGPPQKNSVFWGVLVCFVCLDSNLFQREESEGLREERDGRQIIIVGGERPNARRAPL